MVSAVDDVEAAVVVRLGEHRGDEVLVAGHGRHDPVESYRQVAQGRRAGRGLPEGVQDRSGELHRLKALAADVTQ